MSDELKNSEQKGNGVAESLPEGEVYVSLSRSNAQIRKERGDDIAEALEIRFKRSVEDLEMDIRRKERERKNMYDFSPNSTTSLVLAKNVDAKEIQEKDDQLSYEIRDLGIKLRIKKDRFLQLFGKEI